MRSGEHSRRRYHGAVTRKRHTPVIGLLGGVASGKSAVAARLAELGGVVLDADVEVGGLLQDPAILARIAVEVDSAALADGRLDRRVLADAVFNDAAKRGALEAILHPPVIEAARRLIDQPPPGASALVIDAPLLLEAGLDSLCDELWFIDTPAETRRRWALERRGWDAGELERREAAQVSLQDKRRRATRILANDASLDDLRRRVDEAWASLRA